MAIQQIVSAIDAYIARLKEARELIESLYFDSETSDRKPGKREVRNKPQAIEAPASPPSIQEVAVQIIPARAARGRRRQVRPISTAFSPLGGPIPQGPVVIRSSDLARMRSASNQVSPTVQTSQPAASAGALEELAQEVAKRLASGGSFRR